MLQNAATISGTGEESVYKLLVDAIEDYAIYSLDPSGHVITWNPGAERCNGYTSEEALGKHFKRFFLPEDIAAGVWADHLHEAEKNGGCAGEGWRVRKDGERIWASFALTAMRNDAGALTGFAKITRDLSTRKQSEDKMLAMETMLREEHERLHAAMESSMDAFYICTAVRDSEGNIEDFAFTYLNSNVEKMVAIPRSELLGARICEVLPVNRTIGLFEMYRDVVLTGAPLEYEFAISDPSVKNEWIRVQAVKLHDGIAITASDITARKRTEALVLEQAQRDPLTGLSSRIVLNDLLGQAMRRADRSGRKVGIYLLDLDGLKHVNDSFGHAVGDAVLVSTANALRATVRGEDSLVRIGGDEFVVIMVEIAGKTDALVCAAKMVDSLAVAMRSFDTDKRVTCSIGVALYPDSALAIDQLLVHADSAMYIAKRCGKNQVYLFDPEM